MNAAKFVLWSDDINNYCVNVSSDTFSSPFQTESTSEDRQAIDGVPITTVDVIESDVRESDVSDLDLSQIEENQEVIISQLDILNNNIVTLQEDNKITIGLLFAVIVVVMVSISFKLLYKILGLGQM